MTHTRTGTYAQVYVSVTRACTREVWWEFTTSALIRASPAMRTCGLHWHVCSVQLYWTHAEIIHRRTSGLIAWYAKTGTSTGWPAIWRINIWFCFAKHQSQSQQLGPRCSKPAERTRDRGTHMLRSKVYLKVETNLQSPAFQIFIKVCFKMLGNKNIIFCYRESKWYFENS